jgi:hypothetical protein
MYVFIDGAELDAMLRIRSAAMSNWQPDGSIAGSEAANVPFSTESMMGATVFAEGNGDLCVIGQLCGCACL